MSLLFLSIAFLFVAPVLGLLSLKKDYFYSSLSGFVFVIIAALVAVDIVPELISQTGPMVLVMVLLGLALPTLTEKWLKNGAEAHKASIHKVAIVIGILGLALHTLTDGAALAMQADEHHLALSVALHRIPIGLFVWWFIRPHFGAVAALAVLLLIAGGTLLGFTYTDTFTHAAEGMGIMYFQGFVVGTLIHVLLHKPPAPQTSHARAKLNQRAEGAGNLLGLLSVFYLLTDTGSHAKDHAWFAEAGDTLVYLALETAPMLLLAFVFAGVIKAFMPESFVTWLKQGGAFPQAARGMAVGIPLPLCSCSVVPVYHSLISKGVPQSAAIAFLIATPELGIDALLISLPLLGAEMTVIRLVAAALLAVTVALLVVRFAPKGDAVVPEAAQSHSHQQGFGEKLKAGMHYSLHDLLDHIAPWILLGMLIAAFIHPVLGNLSLAEIPGGLQVLLFALLGIPVYVCASSATPLVAIFLVNGVSPGAGLAFLLAGPATNISTFGILAKLHNRGTAMVLAVSCFTTAVLLGLGTNALFPNFQPVSLGADQHQFGWLHWSALVLLLSLFAYSIYRKGMHAFIAELIPHQHMPGEVCTHHGHHHHGHHHHHEHSHHHGHDCGHHHHEHEHEHQHGCSHQHDDAHDHGKAHTCSHSHHHGNNHSHDH